MLSVRNLSTAGAMHIFSGIVMTGAISANCIIPRAGANNRMSLAATRSARPFVLERASSIKARQSGTKNCDRGQRSGIVTAVGG